MKAADKKLFIVEDLIPDKFERKKRISKICRMLPVSKISFSKIFISTFIIWLQAIFVFAQTTTPTDSFVYITKLTNGMNFLMAPRHNDNKVEISYHIKVGTVYENDTVNGISYITQGLLAEKIAAYLRNDQNPISFNNTAFRYFVTPDFTIFQLSTPPSNYTDALRLLRDSVHEAVFEEQNIIRKKEQVKKQVSEVEKSYRDLYSHRLRRYVYRDDAPRQIMTGDTADYQNIHQDNLTDFYAKYYGSNNVIVNAVGNFNLSAFQDTAKAIFRRVRKTEFDPEQISKVFDFKSMIFNSRFTITAPEGTEPEIKMSWAFPGTRSNVFSSHCGFLLTTLINDENNFIQVKARRMGCKMLRAEYDANIFSSIFTVTIKPGKENFFEVYEFVKTELKRMDQTLMNESMMAAAKANFKVWFQRLRLSPVYPSQITRFWVYNNERYLPTLSDSVMNISTSRMNRFLLEYINQSATATALIISESDKVALNTDSVFVDFDDSVRETYFAYKANQTDVEGPENLSKYNRLLQWLRENPDVTVQINGRADNKEINMVKDEGILAFIDSISTFKKAKGVFLVGSMTRTEMLRALKVARMLYLDGIAPERIKGSSMAVRSKTKEEEAANRRCTFTLDKQRYNNTLRDYYLQNQK